ncbi:MAG TPA: hypothetical protein VHY19_01095 [Steroidobacteraceae bacterium]|jgi:hypothetical protein|nr:hypothetical protein [Steroidobacteraceae bacterium]
MAVIDILQKIREESERLLGELDSSSSRIYEITTAGTIVERTHQLRTFYGFIVRQLGHAIELLGAGDAQRHG